MKITVQFTEAERKVLNEEVAASFQNNRGEPSEAAEACEVGFQRAIFGALREANDAVEIAETVVENLEGGFHHDPQSVSVQLRSTGNVETL